MRFTKMIKNKLYILRKTFIIRDEIKKRGGQLVRIEERMERLFLIHQTKKSVCADLKNNWEIDNLDRNSPVYKLVSDEESILTIPMERIMDCHAYIWKGNITITKNLN